MKNKIKNLLVVVDYQHDFVKGALPVPGAALIKDFIQEQINNTFFDHIVYTMDTHNQAIYKDSEEATMFPEHCAIETEGWDLYELKTHTQNLCEQVKLFGADIQVDNESVFIKDKFSIWEGNPKYKNWCIENLNEETNIFVCGVATNYCVAANVFGYENLPFKVNQITVFKKGCKGILDNTYGNTIKNMELKNIKFI